MILPLRNVGSGGSQEVVIFVASTRVIWNFVGGPLGTKVKQILKFETLKMLWKSENALLNLITFLFEMSYIY